MRTTRHLPWFVLSLLAMLLSLPPSLPATGEELPPPELPPRVKGHEGDVALIIAQEGYQAWSKVPGAKANGEAWERYFKESLGMTEVTLATDRYADKMKSLVAEVSKKAQKLGSEGRLWFVYIGHGAPGPGEEGEDEPMLLGVEAPNDIAKEVKKYSAMRRDLLTELARSGREVVVVLDACYSSEIKGSLSAYPTDLLQMVPDRVLILAAASAGEVTGQLAEAERPAFSYLLLEGLSKGDSNNNREVSAAEALAYAKEQLGKRALQKTTQTPQLEVLDGKKDTYAKWVLGWPSNRCEGGKVSSDDTRGECCWPGQAWSSKKKACVGEPECPKGLQADGNDCVKAVAQASKPTSTSGSGSVSAPSTASTQTTKASTGSSTTQTSVSGSNDNVSSSLSGSKTSATAAAAKSEEPVCASGMEVGPDTKGHCCWPGQWWNGVREACLGEPTACPKGMRADGRDCVKATQASKPTDEAMIAEFEKAALQLKDLSGASTVSIEVVDECRGNAERAMSVKTYMARAFIGVGVPQVVSDGELVVTGNIISPVESSMTELLIQWTGETVGGGKVEAVSSVPVNQLPESKCVQGWDDKPVPKHNFISMAEACVPIVVEIQVPKHPEGYRVILHYQPDDEEWKRVQFTASRTESDRYTAEIPADATKASTILYYIVVVDQDGVVTASVGSLSKPIAITLIGDC